MPTFSQNFPATENTVKINRNERPCTGSELFSDQLLNALQTSILFFDTAGIIRRVNTQACEDLKTDKEITGCRITDIITVIYLDKNILPGLLETLRDGKTNEIKLPEDSFIQNPETKSRFFVSGKITRLECGEFLLSFRNIVEELTQEYMLKMALSSTKIFPWFYDMERNTMVIDPRYFTYTGIQSPDYTLSLEQFALRLHPDDRKAMAGAFEQQLNGIHYPYPVPFRLLRGDGQWEWFEGQSTYLGKLEGVPYRVVGICMSTQAHKDIEESLIAARDKAQQSDRLKSAFLANMSHEIRTPLNAIVGFSSLLTGGSISVESPEAKEYADIINTNCNHLLTLISDILDLSRIESGTMEYKYSRQSLNNLLKDIYQTHSVMIPPEVNFNLSLPARDVQITTDPVRLRQLVDNLLTNARKFTWKGHITLGYRMADGGNTAEIFVEDTGRGIPQDQFEKIFERFHKVDSFVQGAGLGLSICKTIADCLDASINVPSRLGEGSCFTVRLPAGNKTDTAAPGPGKKDTNPGQQNQ